MQVRQIWGVMVAKLGNPALPRPLEIALGVLVPTLVFSVGILGSIGLNLVGPAAAQPDGASESTSTSTSDQPVSSTATATPTPVQDPQAEAALDQLAQLADAPAGYRDGYVRDYFGHGWIDTDRNGCDTRNDILDRDLEAVIYKPNTRDCVVLSGELDELYTGKTISFLRGNETSTLVQIDHIVPLGYSWQVGTATWPEEQRIAFANDPSNLLAADGTANQVKSANGPADWMPDNEAFHCSYIERFVGVLSDYALAIKAEDRIASERVLRSCV
ncbi:HNH endonuclease family protein [Salinibacterium sp. SWN1162]|uniref:HNH endonuclease family protein n=1 Tax=Salinibacterium sp. SWN1162 TaxID=2792053 RepID=UPI0018CEB50B|nr:HNH endonuclease family protein [Salinibacterium sp. SWN1162]MBH0008613.1 HNH endonuclease [Salinibacterium sp. SWN1162]